MKNFQITGLLFVLHFLLVSPNTLEGGLADESSNATPAPTEFISLAVYPPEVSLNHARDWQNAIAVATRADGVTLDVTKIASWNLQTDQESNDPPAEFHQGRIIPLINGQGLLSVSFAGLQAQVKVTSQGVDVETPINFRRDVIPILTRSGCNAGGCHGSSLGKDGFRLSLFGFDPSGDYHRLTREIPNRRLNLALPEESLLMLKATGSVPHTGGKLFEQQSIYYRELLEWIADGAVDDQQTSATVESLDIYPPQAVMGVDGQSQQFVAVATYSDQSTRDVSHLALFQSNNSTSASIDDQGLVSTGKRGEAFVMARFDTHTVGSQVIVLPDQQDFEPTAETPVNYIDQLVGEKLRKLRMHPSPLVGDEEFLRRVTLDISGRLPTVEEHEAFLADETTDKRSRKIDELLAGPEFPKIWGLKWAELLLVRSEANRVEYKPMFLYSRWLTEQIAADRPLNEMVRDLISASGSTFHNPATNFYQIEPDTKKIAENVAQTFLGIRVQCAQCHNHPFDRWTMDDYYSFASFFAQIGRKRGEDYREWYIFNSRGGEQRHPVDNRVMPPKFLGGEQPTFEGRPDRRAVLADWVVSPENPYFGISVANRVWAHFFGIGIVEPVDDFRVSNPASNPDLLGQLAEEFVASNYNLRQLVRAICLSNAYQRSCETNASNAEDTANFARAQPRRISAEVLLDCIGDVTGHPEKLPGLPLGARAVEIADGRAGNYFLTTFGRARRDTVCACESKAEPTLSQALHMINGHTIHAKIAQGKLIEKWLDEGASAVDVVDRIYLRSLCRRPTDLEREELVKSLPQNPRPVGPLQDIFWAVLNSREFLFNH